MNMPTIPIVVGAALATMAFVKWRNSPEQRAKRAAKKAAAEAMEAASQAFSTTISPFGSTYMVNRVTQW